MAARSTNRHRSIPVNVVVERRAERRSAPPTPLPTPPRPPTPPAVWAEHRRRRLMWIIVSIGALVVILGWVTIFSAQLQGTNPTFLGDVTQRIRNVKWPWEPEPLTPQEQEIRTLEEQVFPQFQ